MTLKTLLILPLIFLGAAASPQNDCGAALGGGDQQLPAPLDLTGRPAVQTGHAFTALPTPEANAGCLSPLPAPGQPSSLRSDSADVLHGLPNSDLLRPIDEPKRAPLFQ